MEYDIRCETNRMTGYMVDGDRMTGYVVDKDRNGGHTLATEVNWKLGLIVAHGLIQCST